MKTSKARTLSLTGNKNVRKMVEPQPHPCTGAPFCTLDWAAALGWARLRTALEGPCACWQKPETTTPHCTSGVWPYICNFSLIYCNFENYSAWPENNCQISQNSISLCTGLPLNRHLTHCLFPHLERLIRNNLNYPIYCFFVCNCSFP